MPKLARALGIAVRWLEPHTMVEHLPPGNRELRRQIARRYWETGVAASSEDIVITSDALEALNLCLFAVAAPGDAIAIECPSFYHALETLERFRMRAVEIPTEPGEGVSLSALTHALDKHASRACWFTTNFQNPLGSLMPEDKKKELVRLLANRDVPLIEDDMYGSSTLGRTRRNRARCSIARGSSCTVRLFRNASRRVIASTGRMLDVTRKR